MSSDFVPTLQDIAEENLRAVASYSADDYNIHYVRDDVDTNYSISMIEDIHQHLAVDGLSKQRLESLFEAGNHHSSMHEFDDALVFHFSDDEGGLFVSVDRHAPISLSRFLERCRDEIVA